MVLPGFVATDGFPATELRQRSLTRWLSGGSAAPLTTSTAGDADATP